MREKFTYSLFTLAWNSYELVHGIVLKNGSASVYTSLYNRCVYHTHSLIPPADGCCYGYFTVFISA